MTAATTAAAPGSLAAMPSDEALAEAILRHLARRRDARRLAARLAAKA